MTVLDTCALLYFTLDPDRLSGSAAREIHGADRLLVSSISIWEVGIKVLRGALALPLSLEAWADGLVRVDRLTVLPVDTRTWLKNLELDWEHCDPADRTIVATALLAGASLVTSDRKILAFYPQAVW